MAVLCLTGGIVVSKIGVNASLLVSAHNVNGAGTDGAARLLARETLCLPRHSLNLLFH